MTQRPKGSEAQPSSPVRVVFRMAAEHIDDESVHLVAEFNDWSPTATPMARSGNEFVASVQLMPGRTYRYKFLIGGTRWENDWHADAYVPNEYGGEDSLLDLTDRDASHATPAGEVADPDSPGAAVDDLDGEVPEPNEPA